MSVIFYHSNYRKSSTKLPRGLIKFQALREGGLLERGGLIEGGGAYSKSYIFDEIQSNFPNCTITPAIKTEQETGFDHHFTNAMSLTQAGNKDEVSIRSA